MEEPIYIYIDESGTDDSSPFLVLSVTVTEEPIILVNKIKELIQKIIKDPEISSMDKMKNGISTFHYTEDNHEVRNKFIELLPQMNYDAYCSFIRKDKNINEFNKLDSIHKLFKILLNSILQKHHYRNIFITYESLDEGSEKMKKEFELIIEKMINVIYQKTGKKILNVNFEFRNKEELLLSIPDYLAGITKDNLIAREQNKDLNSFEIRNYQRISGKIRLLNDFTNKKFYSRGESI